MASEEPLFDPSLKKRKKKQVAFTEDPLGADADPTAPAPETIDSTTLNGDAVDLGPATAHERMKANGDEGAEKKKEDDDFKAMFGDVKKKKKKKEIPMDFVGCCSVITVSIVYSKITVQGDDSGTSTPIVAPTEAAAAPAITSDDLDFSDIKKKKKSSKKKAAFDLDAFEKELNDSKAKTSTAADDEEDDGPADTSHLDNIDDAELGDDPFAQGDAPVGVDAGTEAWLKSDRDYTYQEVCDPSSAHFASAKSPTAPHAILLITTRRQPVPALYVITKTVHNRTALHPS